MLSLSPLDSRHKRILRELIGVASGQRLAAVGTLVGLRLLTSALGTHEFGVLALALTAPLLLAAVVYAGPGQAVMRFYVAADERGEGAAFLAAAWRSVRWRTWALLGQARPVGGCSPRLRCSMGC
jgi:O-antigen/teichoic acid export membrane protein